MSCEKTNQQKNQKISFEKWTRPKSLHTRDGQDQGPSIYSFQLIIFSAP